MLLDNFTAPSRDSIATKTVKQYQDQAYGQVRVLLLVDLVCCRCCCPHGHTHFVPGTQATRVESKINLFLK